MKVKLILIAAFWVLLAASCTERTTLKPDELFIGRWELKGRKMLEGIQVEIKKEGDQLVGRVIKLNDNKYVNMFVDSNSVWVAGISRTSNFQFKLIENKMARELFGLYDLSGSQEFNVQFINEKTIGLVKGNLDPLKSTVLYKKI